MCISEYDLEKYPRNSSCSVLLLPLFFNKWELRSARPAAAGTVDVISCYEYVILKFEQLEPFSTC